MAWDNYKAGVIDLSTGKTVVPIRFDELYWRIQTFENPEPGIPRKPPVLIGFACFTDEGESVAYDTDGEVDEWRDWELPMLSQSELPQRTVESIEKEVRKRFYTDDDIDDLRELLVDRCRLLNVSWQHSAENVSKISRLNDMLNAAIHEALAIGKSIEQSLSGEWSLRIDVYPGWDNNEDWDDDEDIRDIIVQLGYRKGISDYSPCFEINCANDCPGNWDFKSVTLDDGVSWDEGVFRRPAYQDCYFLQPFQQLASENYLLAFSDLVEIKNFQIRTMITQTAKD